MNKSLVTNLVFFAIALVGQLGDLGPLRPHLTAIGYFGLSGAITNWLAIHMLFERVPGLYGSGIIPLRFEAFKQSIYALIMHEFFTQENIAKFAANAVADAKPDIEAVLKQVDYDQIFDGFVEAAAASKFGAMLAMAGGPRVLDELRAPFATKLRAKLETMASSPKFLEALAGRTPTASGIRDQVAAVVEHRLSELSPHMVKEIVQEMIRTHLGWLVVWGGVFGGLIGLATSLLPS